MQNMAIRISFYICLTAEQIGLADPKSLKVVNQHSHVFSLLPKVILHPYHVAQIFFK